MGEINEVSVTEEILLTRKNERLAVECVHKSWSSLRVPARGRKVLTEHKSVHRIHPRLVT
jgi:hypothetical protein